MLKTKLFSKVDKFFFWIVISLVAFGLLMFISASFGVLAKNTGKFTGIIINQIALGLGLGSILFFAGLKIPYEFWRNNAFYILLGALGITMLVFIPGLGFSHGGAQRWLSLGPISFQPAEILKIACVTYFSAWIAWVKPKTKETYKLIIPFIILLGVVAGVLLKQPDTKSLILITFSLISILFVAGISWKYIIGIISTLVIGAVILVASKPYLLERVKTFLDPTQDPLGSSFQLNQSLIAIGSGGVTGRGWGQSVQKFTYLPEPHGDSIFAVIGEELGFIGTLITILLYILFALRGLRIAARSPDEFSRLFVTGLVILIVTQAFMNIASISGLFPLTGVPLPFISHGGTSLAITLGAVGIILHISTLETKRRTI